VGHVATMVPEVALHVVLRRLQEGYLLDFYYSLNVLSRAAESNRHGSLRAFWTYQFIRFGLYSYMLVLASQSVLNPAHSNSGPSSRPPHLSLRRFRCADRAIIRCLISGPKQELHSVSAALEPPWALRDALLG
jgi:hypothetical protein